jgi:ATP-binding cassette, subfamily F, member 3
VMEIRGLKKTYLSDREAPVPVFTENQDAAIERGDKIALVGANGAGKSTLARIINGTEPFDGQRVPGHNVIMTFFAQHLADVLASERTVLEEMEASARTSEARTRIRGILGAFLFSGDDVFKKVGVLSGGERSRLALAKSLLEPANLLILDEPTNHLDIRSRKVLLQALEQYQGTVVAVSHDRYFLSGFANKVWRVGNGRLYEYPGDFSYYEWKYREQKAGSETGTGLLSGTGPSAGNSVSGNNRMQDGSTRDGTDSGGAGAGGLGSGPKSREVKRAEAELRNRFSREMKPLKQKLAKLETEIDRMEKEKSDIEQQLADPAFYETGDAQAVLRNHGDLERRLERSWNSWTEATTRLEEVEARFDAALEEILTQS